MFHASSFRPATGHKLRIGADNQGRLLGGTHLVRAQTSRFDLMPYTGQETLSRLYAWPAYRGATTLVQLDCQTPGFMRAPMEMASFFALESAVDELAAKVGLDPVALRIQNDAKIDPITGKPFSSRHLTECLQRGAALFGWDARVATPGSMRLADGTRIGYGVARVHTLLTSRRRSPKSACTPTGVSRYRSAAMKWVREFAPRSLWYWRRSWVSIRKPQRSSSATPSFHHSTLHRARLEPLPSRCRSATRRSSYAKRWRS
jgi:CO/xanthine dehydrogenase Mo-binding subunit